MILLLLVCCSLSKSEMELPNEIARYAIGDFPDRIFAAKERAPTS